MNQKDAELIQRVLQGDQDAFGFLVRKYQKGVHALVWRKIGDFHIAEEITQDAFFRAYQKLRTLKNHNLFAGWLYVIAARLCSDWFQKKSLPEQSLEVTDTSEVNQVSYSQYVAENQAVEAHETRREVVKKLLQKLPESERTVMTLHYLGEMTIKTISEFLGVSPNTVKSRLSRARNRLKKEEHMIRQNLGSFQLSPHLTENVMREISRITPAVPTTNKPVVPWALSAVSAIALFLLLGVGTQHLSRFQKPYDLNATSERTVELIEAVFVLDSPAKPAVRNQIGSLSLPGRNPGAGQKPDAQLFAALVDETEVPTPKPQWIQTKGPAGGLVNTLFTTTRGNIYAGTSMNFYKLADDGHSWKLVIAGSPTSLSLKDFIIGGEQQMVERNDTLYIAIDGAVLTSTDEGETWNSIGAHPKGQPIGLVITEAVPGAEADITLNLAFVEGVYRSVDAGKSWIPLNDGNLTDRKIRAIAAVGNTLFAGTDSGLYRRDMDTWEKLTIRPAEMSENQLAIHALAVDEHRLYVAAGDELTNQNQRGRQLRASMTGNDPWSLYRSTDQGDTWYSIDPRNRQEGEAKRQQKNLFNFDMASPFPGAESTEIYMPSVKVFATHGRVVVVDAFGELFYSMNTGESWTALDVEGSLAYRVPPPVLMMDANSFYKGTPGGVQRTTDGGKSWHWLNTGLVDTPVQTLIAVKGKLYANSINGFVFSTDAGESWTPLPGGLDHGVLIEAFDNTLYVKKANHMNTPSPLLRLSTENHRTTFIKGMPAFENINSQNPGEEVGKILEEALTKIGGQNPEEGVPLNLEDIDFEQLDIDFEQLNETLNKTIQEQATSGLMSFIGNFAVNGDTYYVEYGKTLYRWKPGMGEWHNTGLVDTGEDPFASLLSSPDSYSADVATSYDAITSMGFKIAVSGSTVYIGKRDGHLFQSFDEGDTWNNVTADIPFSFEKIKAIVFAEPIVYVATDKGVAYSSDGTRWHAATDTEGGALVVSRLAAEGTTVYGQTDEHVYLLKEGANTWKRATPELPGSVISFAVDRSTLYVGTANRGVLRFALDE
ncbi:hypothetical protein C6500_11820 [Candidatus Poribacteria bacterium]|nr:MAG: hypothetical protein C6500_11820 [Candidatus Poribacteria bacterium]